MGRLLGGVGGLAHGLGQVEVLMAGGGPGRSEHQGREVEEACMHGGGRQLGLEEGGSGGFAEWGPVA